MTLSNRPFEGHFKKEALWSWSGPPRRRVRAPGNGKSCPDGAGEVQAARSAEPAGSLSALNPIFEEGFGGRPALGVVESTVSNRSKEPCPEPVGEPEIARERESSETRPKHVPFDASDLTKNPWDCGPRHRIKGTLLEVNEHTNKHCWMYLRLLNDPMLRQNLRHREKDAVFPFEDLSEKCKTSAGTGHDVKGFFER